MKDIDIWWADRIAHATIIQSDELRYTHVPFETVGTRIVRYFDAGPLLPRQFEFDD